MQTLTLRRQRPADPLHDISEARQMFNPPYEQAQKETPKEPVVLWAEDDDNDVMLMTSAWHRANIPSRLVRVHDGLEALDYLNGDGLYENRAKYPEPSLLVLDIKMPGKSGLEVLEWIRRQDSYKDLPVIIESSSAEKSDLQAATQLGVTAYLVKPCTVGEWATQAQTSWSRWATDATS